MKETSVIDDYLLKVARHEAAHAIVWYLFKEHWLLKLLTIDPETLPSSDMKGALNITPNFDVNTSFNYERANEIFAISLAGMIGQNIEKIINNDTIVQQLAKIDFNDIFDKTGCDGDFSIANHYLKQLSNLFGTNDGKFTQCKVLDLVILFQNHEKVQELHNLLAIELLEKKSLNDVEIRNFFDLENFQDYIEEENLDTNFYHN